MHDRSVCPARCSTDALARCSKSWSQQLHFKTGLQCYDVRAGILIKYVVHVVYIHSSHAKITHRIAYKTRIFLLLGFNCTNLFLVDLNSSSRAASTLGLLVAGAVSKSNGKPPTLTTHGAHAVMSIELKIDWMNYVGGLAERVQFTPATLWRSSGRWGK